MKKNASITFYHVAIIDLIFLHQSFDVLVDIEYFLIVKSIK